MSNNNQPGTISARFTGLLARLEERFPDENHKWQARPVEIDYIESIDNLLTRFDFESHLARQAAHSLKTFGPGLSTDGIIDHIKKELKEIGDDPTDAEEWIDIAILALDGAWRCGLSPRQVIELLVAKQTKNEGRNWPDWRTVEPGKAIEHIKSEEEIQMRYLLEVEKVAEKIYGTFDFNGYGIRPAWVKNGNSLKQEEARVLARAQLNENGHG